MKTNRRQFIKQFSVGSAALGMSGFPFLLHAKNEDRKLTILHTNDMHSQIEPFAENDGKFGGLGGFARLHAQIQKIKKQENNVLLFDSGDVFQGTPYFNFYKGELEYKLMSKMGYDAGTLGNHEFDLGMQNIANQLLHTSFPIICSNYDFSDTILNGKIEKFKIIVKNGYKIGIFGLGIALRGLVDIKNYKGTRYLPPLEIANKTASFLKEDQHCDLVVCLSHLGYKYKNNRVSDINIAQSSRYIDIILGGHSHTLMKTAEQIPDLYKKPVIINQVGRSTVALGKIDVFFCQKKKNPIVLSSLNMINKRVV